MNVDQCSAMGCPETAHGADRRFFHFIRAATGGLTKAESNGVDLAFCQKHGASFAREWAGLLTHTDATDARVYVVTALSEHQHRALLGKALGQAVDQYVYRHDDGSGFLYDDDGLPNGSPESD